MKSRKKVSRPVLSSNLNPALKFRNSKNTQSSVEICWDIVWIMQFFLTWIAGSKSQIPLPLPSQWEQRQSRQQLHLQATRKSRYIMSMGLLNPVYPREFCTVSMETQHFNCQTVLRKQPCGLLKRCSSCEASLPASWKKLHGEFCSAKYHCNLFQKKIRWVSCSSFKALVSQLSHEISPSL